MVSDHKFLTYCLSWHLQHTAWVYNRHESLHFLFRKNNSNEVQDNYYQALSMFYHTALLILLTDNMHLMCLNFEGF